MISLGSVVIQRRQTQVLEAGLEKAIEVKITRELDVANEPPPGSAPVGVASTIKYYVNRRLSDKLNDTRRQIEQDYISRLAAMAQQYESRVSKLEQSLGERRLTEAADTISNLSTLLKDEQYLSSLADESRSSVAVLQQAVKELQLQLEDLRSGIGSQAMAQKQIRMIAEQLLMLSPTA